MTPEEKRTFMLTTPVQRLIPRMAVPTIAAMLVTSVYNLADTFFVSQLGTFATGAVGINSTIDNLIMMAGSMMAMGASSYTSRLLGAKEDEHARQVLSTCYFVAFALGLFVMAGGMLFQVPLLRFLGASDALMPYSQQYCRYILLAAPFMATSFVLNQCLRSEGSAFFAMIGMSTGAVLNIILDPIFIFSMDMGVAGASMATAISKLVSWTLLMIPYFRGKTLLKIHLKFFHPTWKDAKEVCVMGSAALFRTGMQTLSAIAINRVAITFGESALAAISVANRVARLVTSACLGFGQGFQPVAGFSWGARRYSRVEEGLRFSKMVGVLGGSLVALVVAIFAKPLLLLFTEDDAELVRIGVFSLRCQCAAFPVHAYVIVINMLCTATGNGKGAVLLGLSRQGLCFFPILYPMVALFGVWGIASVLAVADALSMLLAFPISRSVTRDLRRREAEQRSAEILQTA